MKTNKLVLLKVIQDNLPIKLHSDLNKLLLLIASESIDLISLTLQKYREEIRGNIDNYNINCDLYTDPILIPDTIRIGAVYKILETTKIIINNENL